MSVRVGFIVGKHCDCVEDPKFVGDLSFLEDLPSGLRVDASSNQYLKYCKAGSTGRVHVDVALAWRIHKKCGGVEVDVIPPRELTLERLRSNFCNFIVGWDLIDAALFDGPDRLLEMTEVFRMCGNVVPSWDVQEFIYYKATYMQACMDAGVPTAPTIIVRRGAISALRDLGAVNARDLLQQMKARGWKAFVIKKSFSAFSVGFLKYSVEAVEKCPDVLVRYFEQHCDCPEFIVQEALDGFARHWEVRVFWWGGEFLYAVANKAAVSTGSHEVIITGDDIPAEFLENAKRVGREALRVLPQLRTPCGQATGMTLIRTDVGCSEGPVNDRCTQWDPNVKTFFLNEIEYGGTNYFARHLNFDCVHFWADRYAAKALEMHALDAGVLACRAAAATGALPPKPTELDASLWAAAEWISRADCLVLCSGWGAGDEVFEAGCDTVPSSERLQGDPRLAWGWWLQRYNACRDRLPHREYNILQSWHRSLPLGSFAITSNTNGHWIMSGWPAFNLIELNGAVCQLRCATPCCDDVWAVPAELGLTRDPVTGCAVGDLPSCPRCGGTARPWVRGGDADEDFSPGHLRQQYARFHEWKSMVKGNLASDPSVVVVCMELGCAPGCPSLKELDDFRGGQCRRIRVAPGDERAPGDCQLVSIRMEVPEALCRLDHVCRSFERSRFVCVDSQGGGAEVWARSDAAIGHVLRRAGAAVEWNFQVEGDVRYRVPHPLHEHMPALQPCVTDTVPQDFFFIRSRLWCSDTPVARIHMGGLRIAARNKRLEARMKSVRELLDDLVRAFQTPDYQRRLSRVKDRVTLLGLIREVHLRIMPEHGFPVTGASPGRVYELVMQMKAYNNFVTSNPDLQKAADSTIALSGADRLDSLPNRATPSGKIKHAPPAGLGTAPT